MAEITLRDKTFDVPDKDTVGTWYKLADVKPNEQLDEPVRSIDFSTRWLAALLDKPVTWFYPLDPADVAKAHTAVLETWSKNRPLPPKSEDEAATGESSTD